MSCGSWRSADGGAIDLLIVHLSDLHFHAGEPNPISTRTREIAAAAASLFVRPDTVLLAVSGDVAFSGRSLEYEPASAFLTALSAALRARFGNDPVIALVPGNHDCDFDRESALREATLSDVTAARFDDAGIATCTELQGAFWDFANAATCADIPIMDRAFRVLTVETGEGRVEVALINTALLSRLPEGQGQLRYPPELLRHVEGGDSDALVRVAVTHHPYNWFESSNARSLRAYFECSFDIVLTGHEHVSDSYRVSRPSGEDLAYVEGAVLQEWPEGVASSFNVVHIDTASGTQRVFRYEWDGVGSYRDSGQATAVPFLRNVHRLRSTFLISTEFGEHLTDVGLPLTHPFKKKVTLDDVFTYPDLRVVTGPELGRNESKVVPENPVDFILRERHVVVLGDEQYGKTTLAKHLFQELHKRGKVPLLLSGHDLRNPDRQAVHRTVRKVFSRQYRTPEFERYSQLDSSERAILVDDSHVMRSARGRDAVVMELAGMADTVVLLGDIGARFDDLILGDPSDFATLSYKTVEILPLGNRKRSDLVRKWVFMEQEVVSDDYDKLLRAREIENTINEVIGRSICPPLPPFILVLLQQIEAGTALNLSSRSSSYGYLYESLLTQALASASGLRLDLDTQYSYLAELAFALFSSRVPGLAAGPFFEWHREFCEKYGRRLDLESLLNDFVVAGVLVRQFDRVEFRYPYLYYYFLARYFDEHLVEEEVRQHVQDMSRRLHHEESANVLLFLTYLSKDPLIINSITGAAEALLRDVAECDLDRDVAFLDPLIADVPKLILDAGDPEKRRRRLLEQRDDVERQDPGTPFDSRSYDEIGTDDLLDEALKINVALKAVQMLGQILRNYPGSLPLTEKQRLGTLTYSLGLRALKVVMLSLEQNREMVVDFVVNLLREQYPDWNRERFEAGVQSALLSLAEAVAVVFVKHVGDAVGDEDGLAVTLDRILEATPTVPRELIDVTARLFHFSQFPDDAAIDLYGRLAERSFARRALCRIVWYRFYIYPAKHSVRQKVCSKLGIEVGPALIGDQGAKLLPA